MILNDSQKHVLDIINKFGVMTTKQLIKYIDGQYSNSYIYKMIGQFVDYHILKHEKLGKQKYFHLTDVGFDLCSVSMHKFRKVNLAELNHDLQVNDFLIQQWLELKNQTLIDDFEILTEREIIYSYLLEADKNNHGKSSNLVRNIRRSIPDGLISFVKEGRNTTIAYELELTQKFTSRYTQKIREYRNEFLEGRYDVLIYMCNGIAIQKKIESVINDLGVNINVQFLQIDEVF